MLFYFSVLLPFSLSVEAWHSQWHTLIRGLQISDAVLLQVTMTWSVITYDTICKLLWDFNLWQRGEKSKISDNFYLFVSVKSQPTNAVKPIIQPKLTILSLFTVAMSLQTHSAGKETSMQYLIIVIFVKLQKGQNIPQKYDILGGGGGGGGGVSMKISWKWIDGVWQGRCFFVGQSMETSTSVVLKSRFFFCLFVFFLLKSLK